MQTVPIACWQKACLSLAVQKVDSLGPCIADTVAWNSVELYVYSSNGKPIAYKEDTTSGSHKTGQDWCDLSEQHKHNTASVGLIVCGAEPLLKKLNLWKPFFESSQNVNCAAAHLSVHTKLQRQLHLSVAAHLHARGCCLHA